MSYTRAGRTLCPLWTSRLLQTLVMTGRHDSNIRQRGPRRNKMHVSENQNAKASRGALHPVSRERDLAKAVRYWLSNHDSKSQEAKTRVQATRLQHHRRRKLIKLRSGMFGSKRRFGAPQHRGDRTNASSHNSANPKNVIWPRCELRLYKTYGTA